MEDPLGLGGNGLEPYWGLGTVDVDMLEVGSWERGFVSGGATLEVPLNMERVGFLRLCGGEGDLGLGGKSSDPGGPGGDPAADEPVRSLVGGEPGVCGSLDGRVY